MLSLIFNNNPIPNWIKVRDIQEDVLPSLTVTKGKTALGVKKITIDFYFRRDKLISLENKNELVNWLKGDNFEESKLILPTRSERYYMAKCTNLNTISGSIRKGEGSIEFTVFSGEEIDSYKNTTKFTTSTNINYTGDIEIYPLINFRVRSACSKIKLQMNDVYIELNNSFNMYDEIEFNQDTYELKVNADTNMQILHLLSKRCKLKQGNNTYRLISGNCEVELSWNNKYL